MGQGAVPFLVRRPVDAAAVRRADAEADHVGRVGRGDLDDLGADPAADGQLGHLVDHRLAVGAGRQDRERAVHLKPELSYRPDRVLLLHRGHRDPCGRALGRIIQHRPCTPSTLGGERRDLLVHRRQRLHFPSCGLCFPGGEPLRCGGLGGAGLPGDGAPRLGLGAAGVLPGLLMKQPQRAPGRRLAVHRFVFAGEPVQLAGDSDRPTTCPSGSGNWPRRQAFRLSSCMRADGTPATR